MNPEASPIFKLFNSGRELNNLNNLNNLNPGEGVWGGPGPRELNNLNNLNPEASPIFKLFNSRAPGPHPGILPQDLNYLNYLNYLKYLNYLIGAGN